MIVAMKKSEKPSNPHGSLYINTPENKELWDKLKSEADAKDAKYTDYAWRLIKIGMDSRGLNPSEKISELEKPEDLINLIRLENTGFDWSKILGILNTKSYKTEMQILEEIGVIRESLWDDRDDSTFYDDEIADLHDKLYLRAKFYRDIEHKENQGWRLHK